MKTRADNAKELLRLLNNGPAFSAIGGEPFTTAVAARQFRLWSSSWAIPIATRLLKKDLRKALGARVSP